MNTPLHNRHKQQGAVLIVSLIFLLVITMLAFSGSKNVALQEKMTFASQDSQIAIKSAEIGMINAEHYIENNLTNLTAFNDSGNGGLYNTGKAPSNVWDDNAWTTAKTREASTSAHSDAELALYFIEYMGANGSIRTFRIVSRAKGASNSTERIIEGYYAKKF